MTSDKNDVANKCRTTRKYKNRSRVLIPLIVASIRGSPDRRRLLAEILDDVRRLDPSFDSFADEQKKRDENYVRHLLSSRKFFVLTKVRNRGQSGRAGRGYYHALDERLYAETCEQDSTFGELYRRVGDDARRPQPAKQVTSPHSVDQPDTPSTNDNGHRQVSCRPTSTVSPDNSLRPRTTSSVGGNSFAPGDTWTHFRGEVNFPPSLHPGFSRSSSFTRLSTDGRLTGPEDVRHFSGVSDQLQLYSGCHQPAADSERQPTAYGCPLAAADGGHLPAADGFHQPPPYVYRQQFADGRRLPAADGYRQLAADGCRQPAADAIVLGDTVSGFQPQTGEPKSSWMYDITGQVLPSDTPSFVDRKDNRFRPHNFGFCSQLVPAVISCYNGFAPSQLVPVVARCRDSFAPSQHTGHCSGVINCGFDLNQVDAYGCSSVYHTSGLSDQDFDDIFIPNIALEGTCLDVSPRDTDEYRSRGAVPRRVEFNSSSRVSTSFDVAFHQPRLASMQPVPTASNTAPYRPVLACSSNMAATQLQPRLVSSSEPESYQPVQTSPNMASKLQPRLVTFNGRVSYPPVQTSSNMAPFRADAIVNKEPFSRHNTSSSVSTAPFQDNNRTIVNNDHLTVNINHVIWPANYL